MSARGADYSKLQDLNVQVLGISANNPFSQKAFADSLQLPHPLLSDHPDLKVSWSYGVLQHKPIDPSQLAARRAFFLIDQQGIVRWLAGGAEFVPSDPILQAARQITGKP